MSEVARDGGLLDLERELTCSICTEVLYQPLTLLDCLHTFCGSCLKLWFAWQASSNSSHRQNPCTCPSCRATVRNTRPDAKITTLLDLYLQLDPLKGKSEEEKKEIAEKYKPGDDVIPKVEVRPEDIDEEDRRMVEEVRELSLRESGNRERRGYERGIRHRPRIRDNGHDNSRVAMTSRELEHQSSLRSLISNSDIDSSEMQEELLRQITEEGLLDGIDLAELDDRQQDELTERIAEAYRRRQRERTRQRETRQSPQERPTQRHTEVSSPSQQASGRRHARSSSSTDHPTGSSHPPVSRPHLLEAYPTGQNHGQRPRTSSETRRQTSPIPASIATRQEAARSATDLSQRPSMSETRDRRPSDLQTHTRTIEPRNRRMSETSRAPPAGTPTSGNFPGQRRRDSPRETGSPRLTPTTVSQTNSPQAQSLPPHSERIPRSQPVESPRRAHVAVATQDNDRSRPDSSSSNSARLQTQSRRPLYTEPSVFCNSCGKKDIQYDLHANCETCHNGKWHLCHRCYRSGKGCLNYFGLGHAAWHRFEQRSTPGQELPHSLVGRQYKRPPTDSIAQEPSTNNATMTTDDPVGRLQSGAFCFICKSYANDCFWSCNTCNDGEWGYCNTCVKTGHVCTHPLLPLAHISAPRNEPPTSNPSPSHPEATFAPLTSPSLIQRFPPANLNDSGKFRPLAFTITCTVCNYPIPPNQSRYHCFSCNSGDYDVCNTCYAKLCDSGRISRDNGTNGWRRCLRGHRMIVYYFDDSAQGQRRVIVHDLVGGHFLKDELDANGNITTSAPEELGVGTYSWVSDGGERQTRTVAGRLGPRTGATQTWGSGNRFPPDGGVGMRVRAMYTWLPTDGVQDELSFPRNAEIREALEISSEWYQGCYAGMKGLFPSNYGKVLEMISY